jgi:replicative superfamily II helicase
MIPTKGKSNRKRNFKKIPDPSHFATTPHLNQFDIPAFLQQSYLKGKGGSTIVSLREWQQSLFSNINWKNKKNLVLFIPTSGGKTVVSDVAIAQTLVEDPKAKCIYALPFVAVANEKYRDYKSRFQYHQVRPFYQNIGGSDFRHGNIAICTFEKVHGILNTSVS